ncbi:MAG: hypothetical protein H6Q16_1297 [Bacteroidetes bacterium]|nr:hypothetical protein [Bacteroidota bacterium]
MKNIKKIIFIALLAIFAAACTNEEEMTSSSSTKNVNNKSLTGDFRKYPQYEVIDYSDEVLQEKLDAFNNAINGEGVMPSFDLKMALWVMETHFNYGIVVKLPRISDAIEYDNMNFTLTVPIINNQISGPDLKSAYRTFINNIMTSMSGKNLELSDIYVENITSTSVTFGLDMGSSANVPYSNEIFPAVSILKNVGDPIVIVPSSTTSPWSNFSYDNGNPYETNVYRNSFKWLRILTSPGSIPIYTDQSNYGGKNAYIHNTVNPGDPVIWNANDLATNLVPSALTAAHEKLGEYYGPRGYVMYSYSVRVSLSENVDVNPDPNIIDKGDQYVLYVERIKCAKIRQISIYNLFMSTYTTRGFE